MARSYPRFLFSNPKNTKSDGPFLVHTLEPKFIARLTMDEPIDNGPVNEGFQVYSSRINGKMFFLTILEGFIDQQKRHVINAAFKWIESQTEQQYYERKFSGDFYYSVKIAGVEIIYKKATNFNGV